MLAATGEVDAAVNVVSDLISAEPGNGYLRYRAAHVLAEASRHEQAMRMLEAAVADGFLSVQLLRQELILGLASLRDAENFASVMRKLDALVDQCRRRYAADLPAAMPIPELATNGGRIDTRFE